MHTHIHTHYIVARARERYCLIDSMLHSCSPLGSRGHFSSSSCAVQRCTLASGASTGSRWQHLALAPMSWMLITVTVLAALIVPIALICWEWACKRLQKKEKPRSSAPVGIPRCSCRCGCQEWRSLLKECKLCRRQLCAACRVPARRHPEIWDDVHQPWVLVGVWCHVCLEEELQVEAALLHDQQLADEMAAAAAAESEVESPIEWPTPSPRHRASSSNANGMPFGVTSTERSTLTAAGFSP